MPGKTAICTIAAKNYLPFVRCLMESVRRWHPESLRFLILTDQIDGCFDPAREDFQIILSEDLGIPDSKWFHFKYSILELATAVKPYALEFLFHEYGLERLVYLDPDILLYSGLSELTGPPERASIFLTPHLSKRLDDEFRPNELDILRTGTYNLGFIALAAGADCFRFLRWWQDKVYDQCLVDPARGLFVDQRWVDLVPGLFDGVVINRDPGHNVAYWNLAHRKIEKQPGGYSVNGAPLCFFHFSGFNPENPEGFSKHQNRYRLSGLGDARQLVSDYQREVLARGYAECRDWPYAYGKFRNGVRILDWTRAVHRLDPDTVRRTPDPFSEEGYGVFLRFWNQGMPDASGRRTRVPRWAYHYYLRRTDLHPRIPDVLGRDQGRFLEWMLSEGQFDEDFDPAFLKPVRVGLKAHRAGLAEADRKRKLAELRDQLPDSLPPICRRILSRNLGALMALRRRGSTEEACFEWLNQMIPAGDGNGRLTRLAYEIHESRPDLRVAFRDPQGADALGFARWFLTCAAAEFELPESLLQPMRARWQELTGTLDSAMDRLAHKAKYGLMSAGAQVRSNFRKIVPPESAAAHERSSSRAAGAGKPWTLPLESEGIGGINLIGYARSETGVGESVRLAANAARSCGLPVRLKSITLGDVSRQQDDRAGPAHEVFPYPFHIVHANADAVPGIVTALGEDFFDGKYTIGYWHWELEEFPDRWLPSFQHFHEIWAPSSFCQHAFSKKSPIPVIRIPHAITVETPPALGREHFGLPPDKFLFLTLCDMLSVFERKNPLAAIDAFKLAFAGQPDCHLVVKLNNGDHDPEKTQLLHDRSAGHPISIIDQVFSRQEVNALLEACDCLVSLHRSEGFGLPLAEAMYLGKPVVATAYSGNMEFTHHDNAFLVSYGMTKVGPGCAPYAENALWADPSLTSAIAQMRAVYQSPDLRQRTAAAGSAYVRRHLAPEACGNQMRERLKQVIRAHRDAVR